MSRRAPFASARVRVALRVLVAAASFEIAGSAAHAEEGLPSAIPGLEGTAEELAGFEAIVAAKWVRARELGEAILKQNPDSYAGHFVLGSAFHRGEGDLPRAVYQFRLSMEKYEQRFEEGDPSAPWLWHLAAMDELTSILGEMEKAEEQLALLDKHDRLYKDVMHSRRIWPLLKLRRYDEARDAAQRALESGDARQRKSARADLCGAESEAGDRQRAYEVCIEATREFRGNRGAGQLEFSNAADAALEILRHDEAERLLKDSLARPSQIPWVNPYHQLVELYLTEGRIAEAIEAVRGAQQHRQQHPAAFDQFVQSRIDRALAELFLLTGVIDRAVAAAERAAGQPDREGHSSGSPEQSRTAALILLAVTRHEQAVRWEEEAVSATFVEGIKLRSRAAFARLQAWRARRGAAVLLADEWFLARTLRPYYLGALLTPWMMPEAIRAVGAGVIEEGLVRARSEETLPAVEKYFAAWEVVAAWVRGDCDKARPGALASVQELPRAEVSLGARMHAIAASCALREGDDDDATGSLVVVLEKDPGLLRRMEIKLPVVVDSDGSDLAERAAKLVRRSPRFRIEDDAAFRVSVSGGQAPRACLVGPKGAQLACASVNLPVDTEAKVGARLLVTEFHHSAFALKADLSQSDLTSLDGSPSSARADQKVRSILEQLGEEPAAPAPR